MIPVCVPCWRHNVTMFYPLPRPKLSWPEETCDVCGRRTNRGIYVISIDGWKGGR